MELSVVTRNRGRNKQVGSLITLPGGRLGTFVGYCEGCTGKVCMDFEQARWFSQKYRQHAQKPINKILLGLLKIVERRTR